MADTPQNLSLIIVINEIHGTVGRTEPKGDCILWLLYIVVVFIFNF